MRVIQWKKYGENPVMLNVMPTANFKLQYLSKNKKVNGIMKLLGTHAAIIVEDNNH